jgi:hypothetical protein
MQRTSLLLQAAATGEPKPTETQPASGTGFAPVEGGPEMQSGEALLVEAYAVMWILVLGFVVLAWRRTIAFERRLDSLEAVLAAAREPAGTAKKPATNAAERSA